MHNAITDVGGILVGQAQDGEALTGCTVILCPQGAVAGVDQRGGAPGTRETDAVQPMHLVERVHAVVLAGGSAYGLDAASGVMRYLEEQGAGFDVGVARVPIVPAAILFDLSIGRADVRPDATMGYRACQTARRDRPDEGNAGAGCGASVGKIQGMELAVKAGIGTASVEIGRGIVIGAIAAVNAFGDIIEPGSGAILAGTRAPGDQPAVFAGTLNIMKHLASRNPLSFSVGQHTVIGVIATNAALSKEGANKVAQMAHDGLARTVSPAHTMFDGDTIFALSTGNLPADVNTVGAFAAEAMAAAILNGVRAAQPAGGLPSAASLRTASE